jgi:ATP-dependent Lhr-like helicase
MLSASLRPGLEQLGYRVSAHHGSLAKEEREETETQIKTSAKIVAFATSTLEIGIDIGDIDLVVLDGPAPSISALLQRIGRGNRRTAQTRVMACAGSLAETVIHAAMIERARSADLGPMEDGPQYAVARQQVASYVFQAPRRARNEAAVVEFIEHCDSAIDGTALLDHLVREGELCRENESIRLAGLWTELSSSGGIHSSIEASPGYTVVDHDTGREIAEGVRYHAGKGMAIAGRLLQVRAWAEQKIEVRRVHDQQEAQGTWGYTTSKWMTGAGQGQAVRAYFELEPDVWPVLFHEGQSYAFHFGGTRRRSVIELLKDRAADSKVGVKVNEWYIRMDGQIVERPSWLSGVTPAVLKLLLPSRLAQLERSLARPAANKYLPTDLRLREVEGWLNLEGEVASITSCRWVPVPNQELSAALEALVDSLTS